MKKYLFGILAIAMAVGFSAFTTKKAHKTLVDTMFYYTAADKKIAPNVTNSIVLNDLSSSAKWDDEATVTLDGGDYIGAISFVFTTTSDAAGHVGDDGTLTIQEAIDALRVEYTTPNPDNFANSSFQVGTGGSAAVVSIFRKSTN